MSKINYQFIYKKIRLSSYRYKIYYLKNEEILKKILHILYKNNLLKLMNLNNININI